MPFKFVDDGEPEADDYATNYVWVDPAPLSTERSEWGNWRQPRKRAKLRPVRDAGRWVSGVPAPHIEQWGK